MKLPKGFIWRVARFWRRWFTIPVSHREIQEMRQSGTYEGWKGRYK